MNEVYLVTNRINGKQYVGVTCRGYQERFKEHLLEAANGSTLIFHQAIRKYGSENFDITCLESNVSDSNIAEREQYYIAQYNTFFITGSGYNMTEGGGGMTGYKHTPEARRKISSKLKGHKFPESRNKKIQQAMLGRKYLPEWRDALSKSRTGRFLKEENPFYGKHHSDESKKAVSDANTKFAVLQLDPNSHEVLRKFKNCNEAGEWVVANNLSKGLPSTCSGRIGEVCRHSNEHCTAYTFSWRFEERSID